eukprot:symbB.v1.2.012490.t1/scaffold863.1/size157006/5
MSLSPTSCASDSPTPTEIVTSGSSVPTIVVDDTIIGETPTLLAPEEMRREKAQPLEDPLPGTEIPIPPMPDVDALPSGKSSMPEVEALPSGTSSMTDVDALPSGASSMTEVGALTSATSSRGLLRATPKPLTASMKRAREEVDSADRMLVSAPAVATASRPPPRPSVSASVAAAAATEAPAVPFPMASGARPSMPRVAAPRPYVGAARPSFAPAAASRPPAPVAAPKPPAKFDPATRRPKFDDYELVASLLAARYYDYELVASLLAARYYDYELVASLLAARYYDYELVASLLAARTGAKDEPKDEDQADEADENEDEPAQSEGEGGALDADDAGVSADANLLTDFQHKFEGALREPSRGLVVKDLMILFEGSSIYGRRAGFHKALMVTVDRPQTVCATLAVGTAKKEGAGSALLDRIVTKVYDLCRSNPTSGVIPSFPDFAPLLAEMNAVADENRAPPEYQVTVLHPSGALVIKECFIEQFGEGENEIKEFAQIVQEHNEKFNSDGIRLSQERDRNDAREQKQATTDCAVVQSDTTLNAEYFKSASEACDVLHCRELFSFGSGSFYDGRDAVEIIEAGSDNVIPCAITLDSFIILDKKKALGHLSSMPCIDKAVPLRELLQTLEDCGEADSEVRRANTKKTDEKGPAKNANTEVVPLVEKNLEKHMEKEKLETDGKNGIPSSQGTTLVMTGGTPKKKQKMTAAKSKASPKAKTKGSLGNKTKNEKSEKMHDKKKTKIDAKKDAKVKGKKKVLDKAMTVDDVKKKLHAVLRLAYSAGWRVGKRDFPDDSEKWAASGCAEREKRLKMGESMGLLL